MRFFIWIVLAIALVNCGTAKEVNEDTSETEDNTERRPRPDVDFVKVDGELEKAKNNLNRLFRASDLNCAYVNLKGDTIIPGDAYQMCFADTITYFGAFLTHTNKYVGVNFNNRVLFEIYPYDNGPDYFAEGLFRIVLGEKIGYANEKGEIVIPPKYVCAFPFENGRAKVALECTTTAHGEHTHVNADQWIYINKQGNVVE
ncbi:MAG: WG repeat-containing protein [Crocinitomicaceae bacterium]